MNVYIDESGDLGWTLNQPFRLGGSSQFLTIAALIIPKTLSHLSKRITKSVYRNRKQATNKELKGHNLTRDERVKFALKVVGLIQREPEIKIVAITVKKKNVQAHIRDDANKLYNYMIRLALLDFIKMVPSVNFIPDPRSLKIASGNSLIDILHLFLCLLKDQPQYKVLDTSINMVKIKLMFVDNPRRWSRHIALGADVEA